MADEIQNVAENLGWWGQVGAGLAAVLGVLGIGRASKKPASGGSEDVVAAIEEMHTGLNKTLVEEGDKTRKAVFDTAKTTGEQLAGIARETAILVDRENRR